MFFGVSISFAVAIGFFQGKAPSGLSVGDQAPPIAVEQWIKGVPIARLGHGNVVVVEFWTTWSEPCKAAIPKLTQLAHKYRGKAVFVGIESSEILSAKKDEKLAELTSFVEAEGQHMDYEVAADGSGGKMAKTWMKAAGQAVMPVAFVVDRQGRIAWIGHPMMGLDEALWKIISDKFNLAKEKSLEVAQGNAWKSMQARDNQFQSDSRTIAVDVSQGKFDDALLKTELLIGKYPDRADQLMMGKFRLLLRSNEPAAYAYARTLLVGQLKANAIMLNLVAEQLVDDSAKLKAPDFNLAVDAARRAAILTNYNDAGILNTLAYALFKGGSRQDAIDNETMAESLAIQSPARFGTDLLKEIRARLHVMKANGNMP